MAALVACIALSYYAGMDRQTSSQADALIVQLKAELAALQAQRAQGVVFQTAASVLVPASTPVPTSVPATAPIAQKSVSGIKASEVAINLHSLLGGNLFFEGTGSSTLMCYASLKHWLRDMTEEQLDDITRRFTEELAQSMAKILGKPQVAHNTSWLSELRQPGQSDFDAYETMIADPRTPVWQKQMSLLLSRYLVADPGPKCPDKPALRGISDIGKDYCPGLTTDQLLERFGWFGLPMWNIDKFAHDTLRHGACTKSAEFQGAYGTWLKEKQMFREESKTFKTGNLDEDAVLFLFDILFEKTGVYTNQYWLGTLMMQNPFDMLSLTDIISTVKPDLIIETGTANGGSALLWASMMHLNNIENGRVITVDFNKPSWDPNQVHWGGKPRSDATQHPLWKKHVTFLQGFSQTAQVFDEIRKAVQDAKVVFVSLDGDHYDATVRTEAELYCPFVTEGSYCIIQDTKLSRFSTNGPMKVAKDFVMQYPKDFVADRSKEPFYTQHASGYLKRIGVVDAKPKESV